MDSRSTANSPDLPPEVIDAIRANRKIDAIKRLREARGIGLKEAKHAVEAFQRANPHLLDTPPPRSESGIGRLVLVGLAAGAAYLVYKYFG
jgi:hypothetical protein